MKDEYLVLSLSSYGRHSHPDALALYIAAPYKVYTEATGYNRNALLDYRRKISFNDLDFTESSDDEIAERIANYFKPGALLPQVLTSEVAGQFCITVGSSLVANQFVIKTPEFPSPNMKRSPIKFFNGAEIQTVFVEEFAPQFEAPTERSIRWYSEGDRAATSTIILTYRYARINDDQLLVLKKGETTFTMISNDEYLRLARAGEFNDIETLISVYITIQLTEGLSPRSQPAVFMELTRLHVVGHSEYLYFRHVRGMRTIKPHDERTKKDGYIPYKGQDQDPTIQLREEEVLDVEGVYEIQDNFYPLSALVQEGYLNSVGSLYRCHKVFAETVTGVVSQMAALLKEEVVSTPKTLPIVLEQGTERGAIFLPAATNALQRKYMRLILEKQDFEVSLTAQIVQKKRYIDEIVALSQELADATMVLKKELVPKVRSSDKDELSEIQCLAGYGFLLFPAPALLLKDAVKPTPRNPRQKLYHFYKERNAFITPFAQERATRSLHQSLHRITLTEVNDGGEEVETIHRLYRLTENRLLAEPISINLDTIKTENFAEFRRLLLILKKNFSLKQPVEIIIPLTTQSDGKIRSSALVYFTYSTSPRKTESIVSSHQDEELDRQQGVVYPAPALKPYLTIDFIVPGLSPSKAQPWEEDVQRIINMTFQSQYFARRRNALYEKAFYNHTKALLDQLMHFLDKDPQQKLYSCQRIHNGIFDFVRCVGSLPDTGPLLHEEISLNQTHSHLREPRSKRKDLDRLKQEYDILITSIQKTESDIKEKMSEIRACATELDIAREMIAQPQEFKAQFFAVQEQLCQLEKEKQALQAELTQAKNLLTQVRMAADPRVPYSSLAQITAHARASWSGADEERLAEKKLQSKSWVISV